MTVRSHRSAWIAALVTVLSVCAWLPSSAAAAPGWEVTATTAPTNLRPGGHGTVVIAVFNVGADANSGPVTVTDTLPPGVSAEEAGELRNNAKINPEEPNLENGNKWDCTGNGQGKGVAGATVVTCTDLSILGGGNLPGARKVENDPEIGISFQAGSEERTTANHVAVAGGGALTAASTEDPVTVSSTPASFGFAQADAWFSNANGTLDTQAGSHPYEATFSYTLNTALRDQLVGQTETMSTERALPAETRNIEVLLPSGFVGNPTAVPECTHAAFNDNHCPADSLIGTTAISLEFPATETLPVYNLVPPPGVPAEFGFEVLNITTLLDSSIRSGSDYGITTSVDNVPQYEIIGDRLTIWGIPGEKSHDPFRSVYDYPGGCFGEGCPTSGEHPNDAPFLTLPTSCGSPQPVTFRATSWQHQREKPIEKTVYLHDGNGRPTGFTGCEHLSFGPTISTAPDTKDADTPAGLTVEVKPPVGGLTEADGLSVSDLQSTTVTLPEGMVVNPGQAAGLQACQETEETLKLNNEAPICPNASKVGTDEIETPLLAKPLQGNVYIMQSNPPNLELLLQASGEGVNLKLVGHVRLNEATGQLVTTFSGTPELPFTDFKLSFSGGAQAALSTPTQCGTYTTTSDFTPWGSPFVADSFPTSAFQITSGTNGAPCPASPLPFTPSLIAGSTTDQAGGFTDFSLLLQAPDDEQRIERLQFKVPQGLLGMISQVPLCPQQQAQEGTCSTASQIGHTVVASGPGPYPLVVPQPGQPPAPIYLTGSYKGAPYGLSIVVPVHVGPFTLQTQIVRAKIEVDPLTAQITVTTDALPQVIDGIRTDLRTINAVIDRPGFMFNPTNCAPMSFSGTAFSAQGATAPISSHFQMGSCQALKFKPNFKVSTAGRTSRKNGASLDVKLTYPTGPLGANQASSQSNIAQVKVDLPKQLPSRLTTLQKACTAVTFETNPAGCPAASRVGQVTAVTPVLPVQLTGPAYFVSYGGAKFPELVFVLQGYGVTVYVHAETFISKAGITSSTLRHIPDVPISSFELKLPQGPFSALAANGNLCQSTLKMPTAFTAQNGAVIHQSTSITVTGCAKHKVEKTKKAVKHKKGEKRK
jgi:uncharacterized repeat protein (TIGR01451 family)